MTGTTATVPLDRITLDESAWPRTESRDSARVELFAEILKDAYEESLRTQAGWVDPFPPLVVVLDDRGGYLLADGWHRFHAHEKLAVDKKLAAAFDRVTVEVQHPNGRPPVTFAYEVALCHAIGPAPLTTAEKQAAIRRLFTDRPELSDRAIARLIGVSHSTVGVHRAGVVDSTTRDPAGAQRSSQDRAWLSTKQVAEQLVRDFYELRQQTRRLLGFGEFDNARAGLKLAEAFTELYDGEDALDVIDNLAEMIAVAQAEVRKAVS